MENIVQNYLFVFLLSLETLVIHNISQLNPYKKINLSTLCEILSIICNFGNLWRFLISIGYFMTTSDVTSLSSLSCEVLSYLIFKSDFRNWDVILGVSPPCVPYVPEKESKL
ncbi:14308_t:CDS:2 [Funneliformis geosporum]|nr:14308_t:CDS:2 [Funneliformis geosporum]